MSERLKIALTAVSGVGIFVFGQIVQKWLIEPIQEQRRLIGQIVYSLVFHANLCVYATHFHVAFEVRRQAKDLQPREGEILAEAYEILKQKTAEGTERLRQLSSEIHQTIQVIPCYWVLEHLGIVRKRTTLYEVANALVRWANDPEKMTTIECQNAIIQNLKVSHLLAEAERRETEAREAR